MIGCENINIVTPTHIVPVMVKALKLAVERGLNLPVVYNTGGYDSPSVIRLLDGIIDIYMPDIKTLSTAYAQRYLNAGDYPTIVKEVVKIMYSQVGDLKFDSEGKAIQGLLIRHLVMPEDISTTKEVMEFLANEVSVHTYVNIMAQYHPEGMASKYKEINRTITISEFKRAIKWAEEAGIYRLDKYI